MFAERDAVGGGRVRIANVHICPPCCCPEENMQNEMKTPTPPDRVSEWCGAENWKRGTGLLALAAKFQTRGGIFNRCYLCSPLPAGFVSVKVGWAENFTKVSSPDLFLQPTTKKLAFNILNWIWTHWDVCVLVNKLYWIDETGSLCVVHTVIWYAFGMVYMVCRLIWLEQCVLCFIWYIQKEFIWFVRMG